MPLLCEEFGTSMHRPDWAPTIRLAPLVGGGVVGPPVGVAVGVTVGVTVGVGSGVAALRALRTEVYAAFLLPLPSNSSGLSLRAPGVAVADAPRR